MFWFQNLTENPQGVVGLILPLLIGGLHYTNVQVLIQLLQLSLQKIIQQIRCQTLLT